VPRHRIRQPRPGITHRRGHRAAARAYRIAIWGSIDGENGAKISDTDSGTRRHFNGMTGDQLKQLRKDLGEAIGRPLTVKDFGSVASVNWVETAYVSW
jgi:hypothetical protein